MFYVSDESAVKALVDAGLDVNAKNDSGQNALFYATEFYATDISLLVELGADVNATSLNGRTPLFSRCENYHSNEFDYYAAEYLLKHGAKINAKDSDGNTVLLYILNEKTIYDLSSAVDYLIQNGADVNAKDKAGKSVTDYCMKSDNEDIVKYFKRLKKK